MKNRHILKNVTQRSCVIAGIVALVAIVGMAGSYYYRNSKNGADTQQEQQAMRNRQAMLHQMRNWKIMEQKTGRMARRKL